MEITEFQTYRQLNPGQSNWNERDSTKQKRSYEANKPFYINSRFVLYHPLGLSLCTWEYYANMFFLCRRSLDNDYSKLSLKDWCRLVLIFTLIKRNFPPYTVLLYVESIIGSVFQYIQLFIDLFPPIYTKPWPTSKHISENRMKFRPFIADRKTDRQTDAVNIVYKCSKHRCQSISLSLA